MGRHTIHHTEEACILAARAARMRYYERNRATIAIKMKLRNKASSLVTVASPSADDTQSARQPRKDVTSSCEGFTHEPSANDTQSTRKPRKGVSSGKEFTHGPEDLRLRDIEKKLMSLVNGSLASLLDGILSKSAPETETLRDTLNGLLLRADDIRKSAQEVESDVLQRLGSGTQLARARKIARNVSRAVSIVEDVLMADMEGNAVSLYNSEGLLFQKDPDISYETAIFQHVVDPARYSVSNTVRMVSKSCPLLPAFGLTLSDSPRRRRHLHYSLTLCVTLRPYPYRIFLYSPPCSSSKKMGGNDWATEEQKIWLEDYYNQHYVKCIPTRNYTEFKPVFYEAWFQKWPELEAPENDFPPGLTLQSLTKFQRDVLATRIDKRKNQLINAMRWKANLSREKRSASVVDPFKAINRLAKDNAKRTRTLSEEQVYSKMFYEKDVKPKFEAECARLSLPSNAKRERMGIRRRLTKEAWEESSLDEEQRRKVLEDKARREEAKAMESMERRLSGSAPLPEPYDHRIKEKAIDDLPSMLSRLFLSLRDKTDWTFSLLAGGPVHSSGGAIKTFSIHVGETPLGMDFMQSHPAYKKQVMEPFDTFVCHVHAGSIASSESQDGNKSPPPPTTQPRPSPQDGYDPSTSSSVQSTGGYSSDTSDASMRLHDVNPKDNDDAISTVSDVSTMRSQPEWSFDGRGLCSTRDSPPPHGVYLPPAPGNSPSSFAEPRSSMPPFPQGYSFLDDLNSSDINDYSDVESFGPRSRSSSVSSSSYMSSDLRDVPTSFNASTQSRLPFQPHDNAGFSRSGNIGATTQTMPPVMQNTYISVVQDAHVLKPQSSIVVQDYVGSVTGGNLQVVPDPPVFVGGAETPSIRLPPAGPPQSFVPFPSAPENVTRSRKHHEAPSMSVAGASTTGTPIPTGVVGGDFRTHPRTPTEPIAPTVASTTPTLPSATAETSPSLPVHPLNEPMALVPVTSSAPPATAIASSVDDLPPPRVKRARTHVDSTSNPAGAPLSHTERPDMFGPRRSGRSTIPSTRNAVANQIGIDRGSVCTGRGHRN